MITLNAFIESLTNEHGKLLQMGIIRYSKYQALFVGGSKATNGKGKQKNEPPKENEYSDESSGLRRSKKKGKENILCSYCGMGFHPEISRMRRTIDQMALLLEKNNITPPIGTRRADHGENTEEHEERCHALKASCLKKCFPR